MVDHHQFKNSEDIKKYLLETDVPAWHVLVQSKAFSEHHVVFFLRRQRSIRGEVLADIFHNPTLRRFHMVCMALLMQPNLPVPLAMNLVNMARWGDLVKLLKNPRLSGSVKHRMTRKMREILPQLSLGERISIARQASKALIGVLREHDHPDVVAVLLQNPYFTYNDAIFMASSAKTKPGPLGVLARHPRWKVHRDVRIALLRNAQTPNDAVWELVRSLNEHDAGKILKDPNLRRYPRLMIQRLYEA